MFASETNTVTLRPFISQGTLSLATEFARLRYLFGQAVLDQDIRQHTWMTSTGVPDVFQGATTLQHQAALVLRHCTGMSLTLEDVDETGPPFRAAWSGSLHLRAGAQSAARHLFEHLSLAGIGVTLTTASDEYIFQKRHWEQLSDEARAYLHRARVPPRTFAQGLAEERAAAHPTTSSCTPEHGSSQQHDVLGNVVHHDSSEQCVKTTIPKSLVVKASLDDKVIDAAAHSVPPPACADESQRQPAMQAPLRTSRGCAPSVLKLKQRKR